MTPRQTPQPDLRRTVFVLVCNDAPECTVYFEPEGAMHTLRKDDWFRVEAVLPADQRVEISHSPDGITVWAEQTWGTRAFNKVGEQLRL